MSRLAAAVAATTVLVGCFSSGPAPAGNAAGSSPKAGSSPTAGSGTAGVPAASRLTGAAPCEGTPGFTCSTLRVPLDHSRRTPGTLDLKVAVADNADAPRGVMLVLSGGPGQPGVSLVNRVKSYLDPAVLAQYRMVMFDQRGTGPTGINCADLQRETGGSDVLTPSKAAVEACANQLGRTRDFYRSSDTVQDVELLRGALGQRQLTVNGVSYGTFTGSHYALRHPARVKALILDSVVPHQGFDPFGVDAMEATRRVLKDACSKDPACTTDPVADLAWLVRNGELDGEPIKPIKLVESLGIMSLSTINPSFAGIPKVLNDARNGDAAELKQLLAQVTSVGGTYDQLSAGLHQATICADLRYPWGDSATPLNQRQRRLDRAVAKLDASRMYPYDAATARSMLAIEGCLNWAPSKSMTQPPLQQLLPRTLIVHGTNDLLCPLPWAYEEEKRAKNAKLVVVKGNGHGLQGSRTDPTARDAVRDFLLR